MDLLKISTPPLKFRVMALGSGDPTGDLLSFSRLLNSAFHVPKGHGFLDDFPVWGPANTQTDLCRLGAFAGPLLVGCAAARVARLKTSQGELRVGILGAVATHPDWRGRGVASSVVDRLVDWLDEKKVAGTALWGSEQRFYSKWGFVPSGRQWQIPLAKLLLSPSESGAHEAISVGWNPALFELLQRRSGGLVIQEADRRWFEAHRNVQWYWLGSRETPSAYLAFGRGIDLPGVVHEWGGDPSELVRLLTEVALRHPGAQLLCGPGQMGSLECQNGFIPKDEVLCLFRGGAKLPLWFWGLDGA